MARKISVTAAQVEQVEAFNPDDMTVEQLLSLLAVKSNGKPLVEIEADAKENQLRQLKTAFYDAVNVPNVVSALTQFKVITLTLEGDSVIVAEYGKQAVVTVLPEKGQRIYKSNLQVNNDKGELQYEIKGNYDKQFIEVLKTNIDELHGKTESFIRDYFKMNKDTVCKTLNQIDPVRFVIPSA